MGVWTVALAVMALSLALNRRMALRVVAETGTALPVGYAALLVPFGLSGRAPLAPSRQPALRISEVFSEPVYTN